MSNDSADDTGRNYSYQIACVKCRCPACVYDVCAGYSISRLGVAHYTLECDDWPCDEAEAHIDLRVGSEYDDVTAGY
eukprot:8967689-Pyramimonas_sp.AAC.1